MVELGGPILFRICRNIIPNLHIYVRINYIGLQFTDRISDIYELSRFINWGLSNVTCDNSRHSAECTNADNLFGAYILSCHLVSHMKKTSSRCRPTVDYRVL